MYVDDTNQPICKHTSTFPQYNIIWMRLSRCCISMRFDVWRAAPFNKITVHKRWLHIIVGDYISSPVHVLDLKWPSSRSRHRYITIDSRFPARPAKRESRTWRCVAGEPLSCRPSCRGPLLWFPPGETSHDHPCYIHLSRPMSAYLLITTDTLGYQLGDALYKNSVF